MYKRPTDCLKPLSLYVFSSSLKGIIKIKKKNVLNFLTVAEPRSEGNHPKQFSLYTSIEILQSYRNLKRKRRYATAVTVFINRVGMVSFKKSFPVRKIFLELYYKALQANVIIYREVSYITLPFSNLFNSEHQPYYKNFYTTIINSAKKL